MVMQNPRRSCPMSPTARLTSIVAVAAVTLGGAGLALSSVSSPANDAAVASVTPTEGATTDPAAVKALTRELAHLDGRSKSLKALLAELRGRTQQVNQRTEARTLPAATSSDDSDSTSPAPVPSPTRSDDHTGSYDDDDSYEDSDESDDDSYEDDHEDEHEDGEDHGGDDD